MDKRTYDSLKAGDRVLAMGWKELTIARCETCTNPVTKEKENHTISFTDGTTVKPFPREMALLQLVK